ncbi:HYR domain-containing protein [Weeksellaceae bacterium TAE3-ERU29]|nr:HYR domain-containing protein [Weeksellaceae bacterium TAE3-ERU29]
MKYLYLLLLLGANLAFAQLQPFTINVTAIPETCDNNGELNWTTEGTTPGSTIIYSIYKLPNESTAIATTDKTKIEGLDSGDYKITATQTKRNEINHFTATASISDETIPIQFSIKDIRNVFCGNDGSFNVNVSSGTPPYTYQLLNDNNEVTYSQNDPQFTGLVKGQYKVRVRDACGIGSVKTVNLDLIDPEPRLTRVTLDQSDLADLGCNRYIKFYEVFNQSGFEKEFFFEIRYTHPNTGEEIVVKESTQNSGNNSNTDKYAKKINIETFPGETITYSWKITDKCGTVRTGSFKAFNKYYDRKINFMRNVTSSQNCGHSYGFKINTTELQTPTASRLTDITFTEVPEGVEKSNIPTSNPHPYNEYIIGSNYKTLVPGIYKGNISVCGGKQTIPFEYNYQPSTEMVSTHSRVEGPYAKRNSCGYTYQYIIFRNTGGIKSINLLNPPTTGNIRSNPNGKDFSKVDLYDFPAGTYQFEIFDNCGNSDTLNVTVDAIPEVIPGVINVERVCGGFNILGVQNAKNVDILLAYRKLQIYDEELGGWTTPKTNISRQIHEIDSAYVDPHKAFDLDYDYSLGLNLNTRSDIQFEGRFRLIELYETKKYNPETNKEYFYYCYEVLEEFEYSNQPILNNIYSFECTDGTYNVGLSAKGGVTPYTYQIVKDPNSTDDDNITINNGSNQLFTNLAPGKYYFRVLDDCGNFITTEYDIVTLGTPQIRTVTNCDTKELKFILDGVDYLNFKWYKEGEESTILSTSNELNLSNFTPAKAGTYKLHLTSPITTACVNEVLSVKVSEDPFNTPHAGKNSTHTICGDAPVRLSDYLQEANPGEGVDSYGVWQRVNTANDAGALVGDQWFANLATPGLYEFNYVVDGLCSGQDVATITLDTRDLVAPTVTQCPSDVTAFSTNDINAVATWNTPTFDDNCKVYVTSTHQPGETFPMGNTTVTYTAEDRGGNTANCTFNVIVKRFTCAKKPNTGAPQGNVKVGISNLNRTTQTNQWINSYNDGWIAMESKTKGFVITRADDVNHPETAIENPVEGMIVFDIDENCIKLYDGTKWACVAQGCNDDNASNP